MNLVSILYEPNFIIIVISLIISVISYFIFKDTKDKSKNDKESKISTGKKVLYTFLITFVLLLVIYHSFQYLNKNNYFKTTQTISGGSLSITEQVKDKIVENLTIIADDVDCGLLED
jgi:Na+/H+ antiporter NhaC